jgi:hypothetical protein
VLARGVRVVAERELLEHRPVYRPGPPRGGRDEHERNGGRDDQSTVHGVLLVVIAANEATVAVPPYVVNMDYKDMS